MHSYEESLPAYRTTLLGILVAELFVAIPLFVRIVFGVLRPKQVLFDLVLVLVLLCASMCSMTAVFRSGLRSGRNEFDALVRAIFVGVGTSVAVSLAWLPVFWLFPEATFTLPNEPTSAAYVLATGVSDSFCIALLWAGLFLYPTAKRAGEAQARALAEARREAELLRLRSHLEPHFVLNTLNAIAGMVVDEPREARRVLGALGELFREATSEHAGEWHTLSQEQRWLERYISIVQARHGERVSVQWQIDASALSCVLPRLLLQPLIENAINHGALRREQGGAISVRAWMEGSTLHCAIEDNGPGVESAARRPGAQGLALVERKLGLEAPGSACTLTNLPAGGTRAHVAIVQQTTLQKPK